jgi:hypothetical protein
MATLGSPLDATNKLQSIDRMLGRNAADDHREITVDHAALPPHVTTECRHVAMTDF